MRRIALGLVLIMTFPVGSLAEAGSVQTTENIQYRRVAGVSLKLNVYRDARASTAPVLILAHGGEWRRGDRNSMEQEARRAVAAGFVAVVPDYRLACDRGRLCGFNHPAPLKDLRAAVSWIRESIAEFGGDPDRIAVLGSSAGGHLGQLLATTGKASERVSVVVSWSGPSKLKMLRGGPGERIVANYLGCSLEDCPSDWRKASPLFRVDRRAADTLIVNSRHEDIPLKGAKQMVAELERKGARTQLLIVEGSKHGSAYADRVWDDSVAFIDESLR